MPSTPIVVTDNFTGANGAAWNSTVWPIIRSPRDPQPTPTIQSNRGRFASDTDDQAVLTAFTAPTLHGVDITFTYQPMSASLNMYLEIGWRITGGITTGDPILGYSIVLHLFGNAVRINTIDDDGVIVPIAYDNLAGINDTSAHKVRVRSKGSRHQAKWWLASASEPSGWRLDVTDSTYDDPGRVYVSLSNEWFSGVAVTMDFDDFTLTEVLPPDPGIRVGADADLIEALYVGTEPVVAHYRGADPVPVPPYV